MGILAECASNDKVSGAGKNIRWNNGLNSFLSNLCYYPVTYFIHQKGLDV